MKNIGMKNIGMKKNINEQREGIWGENLKSLKSLKSLMQIFAESAESANSAKQIFATFATFAMQIFSNFVNLVKLVMQIFHKGSYSAVRVSSVQQPTNIQRISNLSPTVSTVKVAQKSRIRPILPLLATVLMLTLGVGNAWGECYESTRTSLKTDATYNTKSWGITTHHYYYSTPDWQVATVTNPYGKVSQVDITVASDKTNSGEQKFKIIYKCTGDATWKEINTEYSVKSWRNNILESWKAQEQTIILKTSDIAALKDIVAIGVRCTNYASYDGADTDERELTINAFSVSFDSYFNSSANGTTLEAFPLTEVNTTCPTSRSFTFSYNGEVTSYTWTSSNSEEFPISVESYASSCGINKTVTVNFTPISVGDNLSSIITGTDNKGNEITVTVVGSSWGLTAPTYSYNATYWNGEGSQIKNVYVGDVIEYVFRTTSTATPTYSIVKTADGGTNNGDAVTLFSANKLIAGRAGTYELTINQAEIATSETSGYNEGSSTIVVVVQKHTPTFTWNVEEHYYYNESAGPIVTKTTGGAYTVTSSNPEVASPVGDNVTIYNKPGTASIRVHHPETYYWEEYDHSESITPEWRNNKVTLTVTESNYTSVIENHYAGSSDRYQWNDNGVTLGGRNAGEAEGYDSRYIDIHFTGMPDSISFTFGSTGLATREDWWVKEKTEDGEWGDETIWTSSSDNGSCKKPLKPNTRWVRLRGFCNYGIYFRNIKITKKEYFKTDKSSLDFATNQKNSSPAAQTFKFHHASAGYITSVTSNDAHFTVTPESVTTGGEICDSAVITVNYLTHESGTHTGRITITDNIGNSTYVDVRGVTQDKVSTTLRWKEGVSTTYSVDHANMAATDLFEVRDANNALVEDAVITLSRDEDYAAKISIVDNSLHFLCGGDVTITAHYAGDETYAAASNNNLEQAITVNKLNDAIVWNGVGEDGKIHVWADGSIPNTVASGHGGIATYSSNSSLLTVGGSMGSYTLTTGRASGLPQEVTLTATSAGDCQYNPATDSKTVVIEPCTHRIVWNQDFSSLTLDEFGNIYYTADLNAYAVDSLGDSTRVPIRYSIGTNDFASLQNGTKLVVQKRGETTLTATTDASDKYAVVSVTRTVRVVNYGENRARINGEEWKGNRSWAGPHVRFNMEAPNASYDSYYKELDIKANQKNVIKWTLDKGCNITITNIDLGVGYVSSFSATCKLYINGEQKADFWTTTGSDYSFGGYTLGNNDSILLVTDKNIDLYNVNLVYLISPSDAPTRVSSSVEEVYVTIDEDAKQIVDLSSYFSLEDGVPTDFELEYEVVNANGHAFIADGHNFWANAAGDYQVRARVKAAVDHRPSEWSSPKTITVTRLPNTIYVNGEADYSTTMTMRNTMDVAFTSTNTNYERTPFVCEATTGSDWMSYSASTASTGQIESGEVLGTTTFHVSQPQDSQYEAAEATFTVELTNNTYEFHGYTDEDWGEVRNWTEGNKPTENDNVTVTGNLVIDEEIEVYSLDISGEGTVTIDPTGGLTVGAGGITGATVDNLKLAAGTEGVTKGQTGYLRVSPEYAGAMPSASVEMYSTAYHNKNAASGSKSRYQCVGVPIADEGVAATSVYGAGTWIYTWSESSESWTSCRGSMRFEAFKGFETTQKTSAPGRKFTYSGHLVSGRVNKTIDLDFTAAEKGYNLLANSYAAPISISAFRASDFINANQEIYILNAGTQAESNANAGGFDAPGKWVTIPIKTADSLAAEGLPTIIPSMQGFWVKAKNEDAQLTLDYSRLVWGVNYSGVNAPKPLRALRRSAAAEEEEATITGKLVIGIYSEEDGDRLYMLESGSFDTSYENGYDGYKISSDGVDVFAIEGDNEQLAVDATNSIIGTRVGVRTGEETAYTMTFNYVNCEKDFMLWDIEAEERVEIREGGMYTFFAEPNSEITGRFIIVEAEAPEIATGVEDVQGDAKVHKFIKDDKLFILKNGVLYDATGMRVRQE